jgi:putative intracellular protease/amidase
MTLKFSLQISLGLAAILILVHSAEANVHRSHGKVLVILSAANAVPLIEGGVHKTGIFLGEIAEPAEAMQNAGYELTFASPGGKSPTIDQDSYRSVYWKSPDLLEHAKEFYSQLAKKNFTNIQSLEDLAAHPERLEQFDALFVPGGHAPLADLLFQDIFKSKELNHDMGRILQYFHDENKPTGLICHAPAALVAAPSEHGHWIYEGYRVTAISRITEFVNEDVPGFKVIEGHVGLYPSEILREAGAKYVYRKLPKAPYVVDDRELMTGQDPFSASLFADRFVEKLNSFQENRGAANSSAVN